MIHLVLFQPEIPQNTGNIGRLAAICGYRLHLIEPLGFELSDRYLRRSGMDYWQELDVHVHADFDALLASGKGPERFWLFTTHARRSFWSAGYRDGDGLLFGNEGHGAPDWLHDRIGDPFRLKIPHGRKTLRSINLATSVGIAAFEVQRQLGRESLEELL